METAKDELWVGVVVVPLVSSLGRGTKFAIGERGLLFREDFEVYTMMVQQHWMASMDYHDLQKC
jgi:hypothetical protein